MVFGEPRLFLNVNRRLGRIARIFRLFICVIRIFRDIRVEENITFGGLDET